MIAPKILVVDDDTKTIVFLEDLLHSLEYQVITSHNGKEGLEKAQTERPDLIVLDIMMPEMNGYQVCEILKSAEETKNIPILMLTAKVQVNSEIESLELGADDYITKPYDNDLLALTIKRLLERSKLPPFKADEKVCQYSITLQHEQRIGINIKGTIKYGGNSENPLKINVDRFARRAQNLFYPNLNPQWRFYAKILGEELYEIILEKHPKVIDTYGNATHSVKEYDHLHVQVAGSRDYLQVPGEFLFNKIYANGDYLVLTHPFSRSITNTPTKKEPLSPQWFNRLFEKNETFRILLIASDTPPSIPGVDHEVEQLSNKLKSLFEGRRIETQVDTIFTKDATYEVVKEKLRNCTYHLVHYAGHGHPDRESREKSHLAFWENPNRQGTIKKMPVTYLQNLLKGSQTHFVYLSCCYGTASGNQQQLLDDDFIGIADGLIHAGIPAVLGYRWPVFDASAPKLAMAFYESLAEQGHLDTALLYARNEIAGEDRDDITWLSPILVVQD